MPEKIFFGRVVPHERFEGVLKFSFKPEQVPQANEAGYVNLLIKKSQAGKWYCEVDTWVPKAKTISEPQSPVAGTGSTDMRQTEVSDSELPF